jgi:hypothetical protein
VRVVEFAFGGFGLGGVVGAGVSAFGHHHPAIDAGLDDRWVAGPQRGGRLAQLGEQVQATRVGGVGVPGRAGPDYGAVGELAVAPAAQRVPERLQQVMGIDWLKNTSRRS